MEKDRSRDSGTERGTTDSGSNISPVSGRVRTPPVLSSGTPTPSRPAHRDTPVHKSRLRPIHVLTMDLRDDSEKGLSLPLSTPRPSMDVGVLLTCLLVACRVGGDGVHLQPSTRHPTV